MLWVSRTVDGNLITVVTSNLNDFGFSHLSDIGQEIHQELAILGGVENLHITDTKWKLSDDTIMHIATGEALVEASDSLEKLFPVMAKKYIECFNDMAGRAPGKTHQILIFPFDFVDLNLSKLIIFVIWVVLTFVDQFQL
jgi:hypothetical protein